MTTMTLQVPNGQVRWFEQMVRTMGWEFKKEEKLTPYTEDELQTMVREGEHDIAAGRYYTTEEVLEYCEPLRQASETNKA